MKNRGAEPPPANVPPLFDPDLRRNLAAWVQKCFPDAPTMPPDEAIRLWLGKGKDTPTAVAGTPVCQSIDNRGDGHRSDDRLAATLQRVAEMVSAALYNEQQRRELEGVPVRHPIHWEEARQVQGKSAADFMETTVAVSSRDVRFDQIGHSTGNNGENELTEFPNIAPLGSWGSEPGRYASSFGAKSNGTGLHPPDLEQSEEIGQSTGNSGENERTDFSFIAPPGSGGSGSNARAPFGKSNGRSQHESCLETESELSPLHPRLDDHHPKNQAGAKKRLISIGAMGAICAAALFAGIVIRDKLYPSNTIGPQPSQAVSSPPAVKSSQPEPANVPVQTSSSELPAEAIDTADSASVQNVKVVRDQDRVAVEVTTEGRVVPKLTKLNNPDRVVLDLADTTMAGGSRRIPVNTDDVKRIRMGTSGLNPPTTRVVVDLARPCEYWLLRSTDKLTLQLRPLPQ